MAYVEVDTAGTDTTILETPEGKIFKIDGVVITNGSANTATVTLKDTYTYSLGDSSGSSGSRGLITVQVPANSSMSLPQLTGEDIIGTLVVNSDQTPVYVYVGVKEKQGI